MITKLDTRGLYMKRWWVCVAVLLQTLFGDAASAAGSQDEYAFDLARQSLPSAMLEIASQTGLQFGYYSGAITQSDARDSSPTLVGPLQGTYTLDVALRMLLEPVGYTFVWLNERGCAVLPKVDLPHAPPLPAESTGEPESPRRWPRRRANHDDLDSVIVIGSRISAVFDSQTEHVTHLDGKSIHSYGVDTIGELFQYLPQMAVSSRSVPNGSDERVAAVQRVGDVVVLINGRRPTGTVDVNAISLVDVLRVEVLMESASAAADASAVGGSVNIVLKDRD